MQQQLLRTPFRFYIWQHKRAFALGLGSLFVTNVFDAFPPLLIGRAVDQLLGPTPVLVHTLGLLLAVTLGLSVFRYLWRLHWGRFHHSVADDLRGRILQHFLDLGPAYFQKTQIGKAMSLITYDVNLFRMAIGPGILILMDGLSILLLVPPVMASISLGWTLRTLCLMPLVPFFVVWMMRRLHVLYNDQQERFAEMSGIAQEIVAGVRVIKSFAQELHQTRFFNGFSRNFEIASNQVAKTDSLFMPGLELFVSVGSVILMLAAAPAVMAGTITVGAFLAFFQYVQRMVWPMTSLGIGLTHLEQGKSSFQRIRELLETRPEILDTGTRQIHEFESLEVRHLTHSYGARGVLQDISLTLGKGQRLGLIGATGSGKSVLLDLILRLIQAPPQTIFINGIAVEDIEIRSLRRLFSVVPQEVFLFQESVHDNLRLGNVEAASSHIEGALGAMAMNSEVNSFPLGLQTALGERGVNLSGGQKQRLTMARAWIKQAPVLVLDDALSAVDSKTEKQILGELKSTSRAVILVTHRLSALESMDHVVVLKNGAIEAQGSLETVRRTSRVFQEITSLQTETPS